jgi:putative peptide maturation dehydrogenase
MRVRRCHQLFVELDQEPRFDFSTLLSGGDGLNRSARWVVCAPHLTAPVEVTQNQLAILAASDRDEGHALETLVDAYGESDVNALFEIGLLLGMPDAGAGERDPRALRDDTLREIAWWPPAAVAQAHGAWDGIDIQARNEVGLMLSSEQMVEAFGAAPPQVYRRGVESTVPLARPRRTGFDDLLAARKTCRNFNGEAVLGSVELATMLRRVWGVVGTLELAPGAVAVKKTSPAGGGLHAVEAYVLVQRVEGLEPGLYHYLAHEHALEPMDVLSPEQAADYAYRFVAGQNWFANVPVMVIMTARFDRLFWKYRRHAKAWRVVHLDVGHLSQTMYLSAADLGLGAFVTAAINDRLVEQALQLTPMREGAIAIVGFGARSAKKTTLELDDLVPVDPFVPQDDDEQT